MGPSLRQAPIAEALEDEGKRISWMNKLMGNAYLLPDQDGDSEGEEEEGAAAAAAARSEVFFNPLSPFRAQWDMVVVLCVFYSCATLPLRAAFGDNTVGPLFIIDMIITALFFVDIVLNFNTGYDDDGLIVMQKVRAAGGGFPALGLPACPKCRAPRRAVLLMRRGSLPPATPPRRSGGCGCATCAPGSSPTSSPPCPTMPSRCWRSRATSRPTSASSASYASYASRASSSEGGARPGAAGALRRAAAPRACCAARGGSAQALRQTPPPASLAPGT